MPEGMPIGAGHFQGLQEILERFLTSFYGALDVHFVAEEFIAGSEHVVAIGRIEGATRKARVPIDIAFVHGGGFMDTRIFWRPGMIDFVWKRGAMRRGLTAPGA